MKFWLLSGIFEEKRVRKYNILNFKLYNFKTTLLTKLHKKDLLNKSVKFICYVNDVTFYCNLLRFIIVIKLVFSLFFCFCFYFILCFTFIAYYRKKKKIFVKK